ncbi:DUF4438 domain-containing protein [Acidaminobacter sp.]|uniref:DUF4438 domain-containing protein n=1 Tax=Acidaminobacter sp. TaxID=1872102 RepID=UPI00138193FB|nr:DUF4438 domain-containing protein [Acidaminobacter sp.]MDK9710610.1 DUF4438 domain-containing protein [Acidaminobacter sp.]MZQ96778.1 DUF4438 domain-containing protein [Acidaminobacter sp.]
MLKTNKKSVVAQAVMGKIHHPINTKTFRINQNGEAMILPSTGSITYGIHVGDPAFGLAGDHIEPSVSIRNEITAENDALMVLSCLGNQAKVVTGDAKGETGYVLGAHGGIEHVIVEFSEETMEKLAIDDKIQIKGCGQGLKLLDFPEVTVMNMDPELLERMDLKTEGGVIEFPVAAIVPAHLMGSGIGSAHAFTGDYDIMTQDEEVIRTLGIDTLRFGDFVVLQDCDNTFGRAYLKGSVSVGVVVHSDCVKMGHGPGIMILMTSKKPLIRGVIRDRCNVKDYI